MKIFVSILLIIAILLLIVQIIQYYRENAKVRFGKFITSIGPNFFSIIAILISYYSVILTEEMGKLSPDLCIYLDCTEFTSPANEDGSYDYNIYLKNNGDISAQVIHFELEFTEGYVIDQFDTEMKFSVAEGDSIRVFKGRGEKLLNVNYLNSKYKISYSSYYGNGKLIFGDTIFCGNYSMK